MNKKNIFSLIFNLSVPLLLSLLIWFVTKDDIAYLDTLNRNIIVPPVVFPIVWTILYILMGLWAYFYSKDYDDNVINVYWISLFFNFIFSLLLFSWNQILLAFIDVIILLGLIVYLFIKTILKNKNYAYFLLPYIIWLLFAFTLMLDLLVNN